MIIRPITILTITAAFITGVLIGLAAIDMVLRISDHYH